mmetsp:Transcript_2282/g.5391  ORF Transcript_2282/g.5391 Transcript_2282/m.5391 type:complete len:171 (-) Transcript_2282:12-524(-)
MVHGVGLEWGHPGHFVKGEWELVERSIVRDSFCDASTGWHFNRGDGTDSRTVSIAIGTTVTETHTLAGQVKLGDLITATYTEAIAWAASEVTTHTVTISIPPRHKGRLLYTLVSGTFKVTCRRLCRWVGGTCKRHDPGYYEYDDKYVDFKAYLGDTESEKLPIDWDIGTP